MTETHKLRVFLCHSSQDKPIVRELYQRLSAEGWIDPWLDEEKLLPGQDWDMEIEKAVETADAVIVCLSSKSVSKEGYIQRELKFVLDIALEKPEGTIFIIPLRLDDCSPPRRLRAWQYVDYFPVGRREWSYNRLIQSLKYRNVGGSEQLEKEVDKEPHGINLQKSTSVISNDYSSMTQAKAKREKKVSISLVLSIVGFFIPIIGIFLGLFSVTIGFFELRSNVRTQAILGIIIGFIGTCSWSFLWFVDANMLWCVFLPFLSGCS